MTNGLLPSATVEQMTFSDPSVEYSTHPLAVVNEAAVHREQPSFPKADAASVEATQEP